MISTINISLPTQLKLQAEEEIKNGTYASFSDFVRTAMRETLNGLKYDRWAVQAKKEYKQGKGILLKSDKDIDNFIKSL